MVAAMRFGIDIAQQHMEFDEIVARARFVEDLGFNGAWGFSPSLPTRPSFENTKKADRERCHSGAMPGRSDR
jgi:hypothetical protein